MTGLRPSFEFRFSSAGGLLGLLNPSLVDSSVVGDRAMEEAELREMETTKGGGAVYML
jgi:hypothetical protein